MQKEPFEPKEQLRKQEKPEAAPETASETREISRPHEEPKPLQAEQPIPKAVPHENHGTNPALDAKKIAVTQDDRKLQSLMGLAESKGVEYAIEMAKKMGDDYVLDMLHDKLAKDGKFKKLKK